MILIFLIPEECMSVAQKINVVLELTDVTVTLLVFGKWDGFIAWLK